MADEDVAEAPAAAGKATAPGQRRLLMLSIVGAVLFGAGGFTLAYLGKIDTAAGTEPVARGEAGSAVETGFVPLERLVVSLGPPGNTRHLRFAAELEVPKDHVDAVTALRPRVMDVLNGYLRAVDLDVLGDAAALVVLRAQMLRRVQVVLGPGTVNDLLITEFVMD